MGSKKGIVQYSTNDLDRGVEKDKLQILTEEDLSVKYETARRTRGSPSSWKSSGVTQEESHGQGEGSQGTVFLMAAFGRPSSHIHDNVRKRVIFCR